LTDSSALFLRYELDADGHAYQLLAVGEELLELYPILDPISFEHALEVEQTILPAIVELFEGEPQREAFDAFHDFFERLRRIREGDGAVLETLDEVQARVLEALRASINDYTSADDVRRRAFVHFYRHAMCENDIYRAKAQRSLERLIVRLGEAHGER
jgi:hypothetical protein